MKHYYIYKITNNINGKIYIGVHETENLNDGYMGSGKLLKKAFEKYGIVNFSKEILITFDKKEDMFLEETLLVNEEFIIREDTYNLIKGGNGGGGVPLWGALKGNETQFKNKTGIHTKESRDKVMEYLISQENIFKLIEMGKRAATEEFQQKKKETYKKIKHQQGEKNSQFGTMWITNDAENRKIKKEDDIPNGWYKGLRND